MQVSFTQVQMLAVHWKFSLPVPLGHEQLLLPPHVLLTLPHAVPTPGVAGQEVGAQQMLGVAPVLQTSPAAHPQLLVPPHELLSVPHWAPTGGLAGQAVGAQHTFGVTLVSQVSPVPQPHVIVPPQLLLMVPQSLPTAGLAGQVAGWQQVAGVFAVSQTWVPVQPHVMLPPHPLPKVPHAGPPVPGPFGTLAQVYAMPLGVAQLQVPVCPGVLVEQTSPLAQPQLMVPPTPLLNPVPHSFG